MDTMLIWGVVIAGIGGAWLLVTAFRESVLWGLGSLFVPFVALIFVLRNFGRAWRPFLVNVIGAVLIAMSVFSTAPDSVNVPETVQRQKEFVPRVERGEISEERARREVRQTADASIGEEKSVEPPGTRSSQAGNQMASTPAPETVSAGGRQMDARHRAARMREAEAQRAQAASETEPEYRIILFAEAGRHLGKEVKVTTRKGVVRQGRLIDVQGGTLTVGRQTRTGGFTYKLTSKDVDRLEVWK